jgi:hypothetical protein
MFNLTARGAFKPNQTLESYDDNKRKRRKRSKLLEEVVERVDTLFQTKRIGRLPGAAGIRRQTGGVGNRGKTGGRLRMES